MPNWRHIFRPIKTRIEKLEADRDAYREGLEINFRAAEGHLQESERLYDQLVYLRSRVIHVLTNVKHDDGCHPSEGVHTDQCQTVKTLLNDLRDELWQKKLI